MVCVAFVGATPAKMTEELVIDEKRHGNSASCELISDHEAHGATPLESYGLSKLMGEEVLETAARTEPSLLNRAWKPLKTSAHRFDAISGVSTSS